MAKRISSKDNPVIKRVRQLEARKYRDRTGQFVLEGISTIREAVEENAAISFAVYSDSLEGSRDHDSIIEELSERGVDLYCVDDYLFASISGTETPQGILAVMEKPRWNPDILREEGANLLVLDRVADPGNMGTMIRTSEAAGFKGIIVMKGSADPYSGKVSRAAAGALMRMPVFIMDTPEELISTVREAGKRMICAVPRSKEEYYDIDMSRDAVIIIGNEASGVREEISRSADLKVGIPMEGKTESLNAAVAACILMYESLRQKNMQTKESKK